MSEYMRGIDVSHHNSESLIEDIISDREAGLDFLIAKATEGTSFTDKKFDSYMKMCAKNGVLRGAYHYVNAPTKLESGAFMGSEGEAYNFVSRVRPYGDTLLALDFEESKMLSQYGVEYLCNVAQYVKSMTGTPPLIYASESVLRQFDFSMAQSIGCGVWVAKWGKNTPKNLFEVGWVFDKASSCNFGVVALQQISSKAVFNGNNINLDIDIANMSKSAWAKYANPRL